MRNLKVISLLLGLLCFGHLQAQEVIDTLSRNNPLSTGTDVVPSTPLPIDTVSGNHSYLSPISPSYSSNTALPALPVINPEAVDLGNAFNVNPMLMQWNGGGMIGSNSYRENFGLGFGRTASVMTMHQWGGLDISGTTSLSKDYMSGWGYMNSANVELQLSYPLSNNMSITGFGGLNQMGFLSKNSIVGGYYGGFVTLKTNNGKFGIDAGMRRMYNPMTGQWTNVPILAPYMMLGGQKLQFDTGGLLLNMFRGLDGWLNPHHKQSGGESPRGGGIIMPNTKIDFNFPPPNHEYIK